MAGVYGRQGHYPVALARQHFSLFPEDTPKNTTAGGGDTTKLHYPISPDKKGPIDLKSPVKDKVTLDSSMQYYHVQPQMGDVPLGDEEKVPFDNYQEEQNHKWVQEYFKQRSLSQTNVQGKTNGAGSLLDKLPFDVPNGLDNLIDIRPQGSATLTFSQDFNRVANPNWSLREQRNSQFKFDQKIQVNVLGSIGQKIKLGINYDTDAAFDFQNMRKINYQGKEDEIVKSIEVGDVSMPISGSLITGSTSLFGVKTKLQFGKLDVTAVLSQQKSEKKEFTMQGGAQKTDFNIQADKYDINRHFFLAQYFRDHFDQANANWPTLSGVQITRIEVWVTNTNNTLQNTRSVAAFMDLGESQKSHIYNTQVVHATTGNEFPDNAANNLYDLLKSNPQIRGAQTVSQALTDPSLNMTSTLDYYVLNNARQLSSSDFTFQPKLGYISLNQALNPGEMLAVAFQYTVNGKTYQVGDFATDIPTDPNNQKVLYLKMLKSVNTRPNVPVFDLMMKNIYSLDAYQVQPTDFRLQVVYADNKSGAQLNYMPTPSEPALNGKPLIQVLNLDRLNTENQLRPDGNYDFLEGITITAANGKIIFPVVEPFGSYLASKFQDKNLANQYIYQELYDSTQAGAQQVAAKDKFFIRGSYKGANSSDISLNAINIPQGSVKVYAGGVLLREGIDYTVDYNSGRVHIINSSVLNSGQEIRVEAETNSLFNIQQKTLMGTRLEYHFTKDLTLGGTFLYLKERPLTQKATIGEEPIRNAIAGADGHWRTDSRFITKMIDKLPLLATKEMSNLSVDGEYARIFPGHPKLLNDQGSNSGVAYLDDFEGSEVPYDLRLGAYWSLASTPQGKPDMFPEANLVDSLPYGFKRAALSWYTIDNSFYRNNSITPPNIQGNNELLSQPYMREVQTTEVFPNKQVANGTPNTLQTFDLAYRPRTRGPYNFTVNGLDANGNLKNPNQSWAGIMRAVQTNDFEAANINYIEFWVMDPFINNNNPNGGDLYFDLGNISEDILRDNRKSYENGLPPDGSDNEVARTAWGRVPTGIQINNSFSTDPSARKFQDVGLDGLSDSAERAHFSNYLNQVKGKVSPDAFAQIQADPSADNFHFFRGTDYDNLKYNIIQRYLLYNNPEGNSPVPTSNNSEVYGAQFPDDEDVNKDFNLDVAEDYFEYKVHMHPNMQKGEGYVADKQTSQVTLPNGKTANTTWYEFKIPIREYDQRIGSISDFKSIRFLRMYMSGFQDTTIMRFATLDLVRSDWRKYQYSLNAPGDQTPLDSGITKFDVSTVSIEKNGKRSDIPYVLPPGIQRTIDYSTPNLIQQNEQSLAIHICDLKDGDARSIIKATTFDVRQYKQLRMFVHAEGKDLQDNQLHIFVRIGTDYSENYYEYELPLKVTRGPTKDLNVIWPDANSINLTLSELTDLKVARNTAGISFTVPYTQPAQTTEGGTVTIVGNPDLGNIRAMMIGVRNPKDNGELSPCADIWVDELRVDGFNEQGGWAATGRVTSKLADFGRVEVTGSKKTIGYGSLEQNLAQRSTSDAILFGLNTTFQLGKFFPQKFNMQIPMMFSYSQNISRPKYNPLAPDLLLQDELAKYTGAAHDSVLKSAEDYTSVTSLNFIGVQKLRSPGQKKTHFYDVTNLSANYIYNKVYKRNITNTYDFVTTYQGQLGYAYTFNTKPFQPFKKISNSKLKLLSDFNLYYAPQAITIRTNIIRRYGEKEYRNTDNIKSISVPLFDKNFTWGRDYDIRHNITKALRITYTAHALSWIPEPEGRIDSTWKKQQIWNNLKSGGNLTSFNHSAVVVYDIPINKLPYLDWITSQANYTGNFEWHNAPPAAPTLGNTIMNSQVITLNGQLNFLNLYNKSKFLRNITSGQGNQSQPQVNPNNNNNPLSQNKLPVKKTTKNGKKDEEQTDNNKGLSFGETMVGLLLSVRNAQFKYSVNNGTLLPGFMPVPQAFGQNFNTGGPGLPFVFGSQADIRPKAVTNGWLTKDTNLTSLYMKNFREDMTGSITLEPLKNFRATIDFSRQQTTSFQENFREVPGGGFQHLSPLTGGNYSISYFMWNTSFIKQGSNNSSPTFNEFERNRLTFSKRLSEQNPLSAGQIDPTTGYYEGYSQYSQDVLIPSFLAAYTGQNASNASLSPFPKVPMPNWSLTYSGLSNYPFFKRFSKSINIRHGYRSIYSVSNFQSNLNYTGAPPVIGQDLPSQIRIDQIVIQERFEPLIGMDVNWINNWTSGFDFKKDRTLSMSFTDRRLLENDGKELTVRAGYRTSHLLLPFKVNRKKAYLDNDVTFRLDFSIRDNKQVIRILDNTVDNGTAANGQKMLSFTPDINYVLSRNLTVDIFVKHTTNKPYTSNQYPTSFTSIGFSLRYILTP
jgi:cell surface protein SprA